MPIGLSINTSAKAALCGLIACLFLAPAADAQNTQLALRDGGDTSRADSGRRAVRSNRQHKQSDKFSNISLTTHHGKRVRFYDDLVKDKVVMINLMFTTCTNVCPLNTVQLTKLHDYLQRWMGREITLLSITIDPDNDKPETLKHYWEAFGSKPGWLFLTGKYPEIEKLRRELGVYDLDPIIDADKTQHSGVLTIGNDRSNTWLAVPIMMHARQLALTVLRNTRDKSWRGR